MAVRSAASAAGSAQPWARRKRQAVTKSVPAAVRVLRMPRPFDEGRPSPLRNLCSNSLTLATSVPCSPRCLQVLSRTSRASSARCAASASPIRRMCSSREGCCWANVAAASTTTARSAMAALANHGEVVAKTKPVAAATHAAAMVRLLPGRLRSSSRNSGLSIVAGRVPTVAPWTSPSLSCDGVVGRLLEGLQKGSSGLPAHIRP
mmetsp:Transcript_49615/g.142254  ORF Transcript_49615/g.142254 Transcript_49615/m.142254 type:complete len:205 (+) Transcript_49615:1581-2195(+)